MQQTNKLKTQQQQQQQQNELLFQQFISTTHTHKQNSNGIRFCFVLLPLFFFSPYNLTQYAAWLLTPTLLVVLILVHIISIMMTTLRRLMQTMALLCLLASLLLLLSTFTLDLIFSLLLCFRTTVFLSFSTHTDTHDAQIHYRLFE